MSATASLPIIDFGSFINPDATDEDRLTVGQQIDRACRDYGFFYLINHGVSQEQYDGIHKLARKFFLQTPEEKGKYSVQGLFRGYRHFARQTNGKEQTHHETIAIAQSVRHLSNGHLPNDDADANKDDGVNAPDIIGYKTSILTRMTQSYIQRLTELSEQLVTAMSLGIGAVDTRFEWMNDAFRVLRMASYPMLDSASVEAGGYSLEAHADSRQDANVTSLQAMNKQGEWYYVKPVPNSFVVNVGDMAVVWSNGQYTAAVHRVIHQGSAARYSVPFFYEPRFDSTIHPVVENKEDPTKPAAKPVCFGNYLIDKIGSFYQYEVKK
ncbi:hypothetical protein BDF22DRAFT_672126 [Syncephalis plumigaleata]|nr:hypothetical protein BDF22DRAFT_672126 [Syncephalis plumigaleata]